MSTKKLIFLALLWAISIALLSELLRPTYLVEKTQEILNFDFSSKEHYGIAVSIVRWAYVLYFAALTFLSFRAFQRQSRFQ